MIYRVPIGSGVSLIDAGDPEEARAYVAQQLGYRNKPWLVRDLDIREATTEEIERHKALGTKIAKARLERDPSEGRNHA